MLQRLAYGVAAIALVAAPAHADFWSDAGAKYQGVTIRGVSESTPASNYVKNVLGPQFTAATGIGFEFEATSWDQMYDKAIKDMEANTGVYDFVYIEQDIIYSYLSRNFLIDVTQTIEGNPALKAPDWDPSKFTTFADYFKGSNGNLYGVPMEAFIKVYLYRTDLFNDEAAKAAFQQQYGRALAPATNHEEYKQIADFFTAWGQEKGEELYGTTVQGHTGHPSSFYEFWESVAPTFGVYNWGIKPEQNFAATVASGGEMNSDKAKAALTYWLSLVDNAPPESTSSTWDEVASSFAAGRAAQGLVYGENTAWIATDATRSSVVGKVGTALPPVAPGVMEEAEAGRGYIGYYDGGAFGIPTSSRSKEAAILFLEYIAQESLQPAWAAAGARITHQSTYETPEVKAADQATGGYYTLMRDQGKLFGGAPPYPFHSQVREAAAPFIWAALTGELTPSEALDQSAAAAEQELTSLGYRK